MEETQDPVLWMKERVEAPAGAKINKLECMHAEIPDYES